MTRARERSRGALCLVTALILGACDGAPPVPALDAGVDAAPRADAGFDPASLEPCVVDPAGAFDGAPFAAYVAIEAATPIAERAFYPFVVLAADGRAGEIEGVSSVRREGLRSAALCEGDVACVRAALAWSEADAGAAADAITARLETLGASADIAAHLRSSGVCALFDDGADDAALVTACVRDALLQATAALEVLGELDATELDGLVDPLAAGADALPLSGPVLEVATRALIAAGRDEAARYEPLVLGENAAALARLRTVDFALYPFSAIVVPGQGPTDPDTALHPGGRARAEAGAARYVAGLAPVILLSGGHVHPDRTRYSEAIEMKRFLVAELGIAADAILVDPYARHTTTNLRNATRILVRAGVPTERPILLTSDLFQTAYIRSSVYDTRCDDELGYRPYAQLQALSREDTCLLPVAESLHVDARDPLDP